MRQLKVLASRYRKKFLFSIHCPGNAGESGMTIIEILIVIALIGTIMTIIMTNVLSKNDEAKVDLAKINQKILAKSLSLYKLDNNRYPTTEEGLEALLESPQSAKRWRGPYTEKDKILDPWGNAMTYTATHGSTFAIVSAGLDGDLATADDIRYPDAPAGDEAPISFEMKVPRKDAKQKDEDSEKGAPEP